MIECGVVDTMVGLIWRLMHHEMRPETNHVPKAQMVAAGAEEATDTWATPCTAPFPVTASFSSRRSSPPPIPPDCPSRRPRLMISRPRQVGDVRLGRQYSLDGLH